jgi:hypothetical protein
MAFDFSGIFGAVGSLAGSAIEAGAIKKATEMQIKALEKQRDFVYKELEPTRINEQALGADTERAKNQLALQAIIDPSLSATRYAASDSILRQLQGIEGGAGDVVGSQAAAEAMGTTGDFTEIKNRLIDTALEELDAGATLPRDVQAELVQAGLERTGSVTGAATSKGIGGTMQRQLIGKAALELKADRQQRAQAMVNTAQNLDLARANILQGLFPALKQSQLSNLTATQSALQTAASQTPEAGLSGQSVANIWLARVGATNQLAQTQANVAAQGTKDIGSAWAQGIGGAARGAASYLPTGGGGGGSSSMAASPFLGYSASGDWTRG